MRVSSAVTSSYNERMFTLVVVWLQAGKHVRSEERITVSYDRLQTTVQTINARGGRIQSVIPNNEPIQAGEQATKATTAKAVATARRLLPRRLLPLPPQRVLPNRLPQSLHPKQLQPKLLPSQ